MIKIYRVYSNSKYPNTYFHNSFWETKDAALKHIEKLESKWTWFRGKYHIWEYNEEDMNRINEKNNTNIYKELETK